MKALSDSIIDDIRTSVAPVDAQPYRPQEIELPFVWVRHPSTNIGPFRQYDVFKGGLLYIDIFDYSWADVDALERKLAWLDNHVVLFSPDVDQEARNIKYQKEAAVPVYEEDNSHLALTYSIQFADMRVYG